MTRTLLTFAAIMASLAPLATAQNPTVCVFQEKQHHTVDVDAVGLANALTTRRAADKLAFDYVAIGGFSGKDIETQAQQRNCAWVVTLHRQPPPPDTPDYAGTLGSSRTTSTTGFVSNSTIAGNPAFQQAQQDGDMLIYDLRKADGKKTLLHGDATDLSSYDPIAAAIDKKLSKAK
jgi:hypothetical protein